LRSQLSKALSDAESDDARRIRALLSWYASGSGHWSYYPSYESLLEMLLLAEAAWDRLTAAIAEDDDEDKRGRLACQRAESERS
jgi:hypothetical protein